MKVRRELPLTSMRPGVQILPYYLLRSSPNLYEGTRIDEQIYLEHVEV